MKTAATFFQTILIFLLLTSSAAPGTIPAWPPTSTALHPHLAQMAEHSPQQIVRVIIQARPEALADVMSAVIQLNGRSMSDLHFINAVAIEIRAEALPGLASLRGVHAISPDAPVVFNGLMERSRRGRLPSVYPQAIGASRLWVEPPFLRGQKVKVAVLDSGYTENKDLRSLSKGKKSYRVSGVNMTDAQDAFDKYGHGTQIAGLIAGNGISSRGAYIGVAPASEIVSVKVCGDAGECLTSDVLEGAQWIYENGHAQNIRVVNFSINSSVAESYHTNPLCAALELLWLNGFVVVVSAGNQQNGEVLPPANDPFVITVGSADDQGTSGLDDDVISSFSAYGTTLDGAVKPDLVAPGRDLVSLLNSHSGTLSNLYPDHIVPGLGASWDDYFRISGTSVAAAVTSGAIALLLQDEPKLSPDQVKYRLMTTAAKSDAWPGYDPAKAGAGYLNVYAAVHATTTESTSPQQPISQLLWTETDWANFGSVNWGTVNWGTVNWGTVNWGTVNWGTVYDSSDSWNND